MLSWRCRRFRARFSPAEPGVGRAHRERCADCHAYASTLERVAAARLPLPESLRRNLSEIPGALVPRPLPSLPLPPALRGRLQGIARPGGRPMPAKPPEWIVQPRYAIAASLLLTLLSATLLGNPADLGARAADFVGREVSLPLTRAERSSREDLSALRARAASRYGEIRGDIRTSIHGLETRLSTFTDLAGRFLPASPNENRGGSEAPRRERRKP